MARTLKWNVSLSLVEEDGTTKARMVLDTGTAQLTGTGTARCNPEDLDIPAIGDELAASRAMQQVARQLLGAAEKDLAALG
ncbi:DUF1876 domain-containing protein [Streptomyces sp. NPDC058001]|uniref:DUF1876 domain-containing protein n=1 Tax=Streptomyces sp. NPDC058001 TaxID=3346300 RepID=UPI0036E11605